MKITSLKDIIMKDKDGNILNEETIRSIIDSEAGINTIEFDSVEEMIAEYEKMKKDAQNEME